MAKYLDLNGLSTFWAKVKTHVTAKIAAITNTNNGAPGASKTVTGFTQTAGKVTATFGDIAVDASQVTSGTLPVSHGGTGGATAEAARENLNVYSKDETADLLSGKIEVVTALPTAGEPGKIYYVGPSGTGEDKYEEYIWDSTNSAFVKVGDHSVDLSDYVKTVSQGSGNYVSGVTKSGNVLTVTRGTLPAAATATPKMDGTAAAGTGTTWARADHVHPTDTSRAAASALTSHTGDTTVHVTAAERTAWNAKTTTDISYADKAIKKTVDGTTAEVVKASQLITDTNTFGNFAAVSDETISGVTYHTYWTVVPTESNKVYGVAVHPGRGVLVRIYSNMGTCTAFNYDNNTTYQFADTYNATTNKGATVATVTNAIAALDVDSAGGSGKYISAISQTDGKIAATASALSTSPTSGSAAPITSGAVYSALSGKQATMTAITDAEIESTCV